MSADSQVLVRHAEEVGPFDEYDVIYTDYDGLHAKRVLGKDAHDAIRQVLAQMGHPHPRIAGPDVDLESGYATYYITILGG